MVIDLLLLPALLLQGPSVPCTVQRAKLPDPGIPSFGGLLGGAAIGIDGSFAATGWLGGTGGVVHLFAERDGRWLQELVLEPPNVAAGDNFGAALLLEDERLVVSATGTHRPDGFATGSLYIYELEDGSWVLQDQIFPAGELQHQLFGLSLAASGERILVGAPFAAVLGYQSGAAYVFRRDTNEPGGWVQEARLLPESSASPIFGEFGAAVALQGERALIGAPGDSVVHVYRRSGETWQLDQRIEELGYSGTTRFGSALALQEDQVLIGAPFSPSSALPLGAVHVYSHRDRTWSWTQTITQSPPASASMGFGGSLSLDDEFAAIGSLGYIGIYSTSGTWIVEASDGLWGEPQVVAPLGSGFSPRGHFVALDERTLLVGEADTFFSNNGAFFFDVGRASGGSIRSRNGPGNPALLSGTPTSIGATLVLEVASFPSGYSSAYVFGLEAPGSVPLGGGTLLCQDLGSGLLFHSYVYFSGGIGEWRTNVPPLPALVGFSFCAQAYFRSGTLPFLLTNALDIGIGSCSCPGAETGNNEER